MFIVPNVASNNIINRPRQEKQEELLRKFQYTAALNRVMRKFANNDPEKVVNFMQELIRRNGLQSALAGRNVTDLKRIIKFIITHLDIRHVTKVRILFKELNQRVDDEIDNLQKMSEISGQLQFLINSQIK
ncbi:u3 small nucleolar rna-associated protein 15-like protein [Dermatophagoides farinae]|uniref:U3 small nucleolar rna-associated protein 15-like protein n=1 Tax=Dermatophagoides farinae TaxID=6954 RepID=A0A9D4P2M8_DERFA|nr:u3 small nucleolar rna-associated protein 15-like protein [Dermatophagoides farinae]